VLEAETTDSDGSSLAFEADSEEQPEGDIASEPVRETKFDGAWGPACLKEGNLTWNEGENVEIEILSDTQFRMVYVGNTYSAELRMDGKLHWSDGDQWLRRSIAHRNDLPARSHLPPWLRRGSENRRSIRPLATSQITPGTFSTAIGKAPNQSKSLHNSLCTSHPEATSKCKGDLLSEQSSSQPRDIGAASYVAVVASAQASSNNLSQHSARQDRPTKTDSWKAAPKAASLTPDVGRSKGHTVVASEPINKRRYTGRVSWFRGSFGWVYCAEIAAKYSGLDAFLHANDCDFKPIQGDEIEFRLALDAKGNPKAVKAQQAKAVEIINARDWFAMKQNK
jgi:hypothetical protein